MHKYTLQYQKKKKKKRKEFQSSIFSLNLYLHGIQYINKIFIYLSKIQPQELIKI
jgi:hypothetical protein